MLLGSFSSFGQSQTYCFLLFPVFVPNSANQLPSFIFHGQMARKWLWNCQKKLLLNQQKILTSWTHIRFVRGPLWTQDLKITLSFKLWTCLYCHASVIECFICHLCRKPHPSGCSCAALDAGHIPAPHHRRPADDLLSEVDQPAHTLSAFSVSVLSFLPRSLLVCVCMRVSVSGQGIRVGVVWKQAVKSALWVNSCTSSRTAHENSSGQVRPQTLIHWPSWRQHEEEQLGLSQMVDIGFGVCCLPALCV